MKKIYILVFLLFASITSLLATPTLTAFNIIPYSPPASNGNIIVGTSAPTYANLHFSFSVPQVYNSSTNMYEFETVHFIARLVYVKDGLEQNLGDEYQFNSNSAPFSAGLGVFAYPLTIPAGKIGGQIKLKYYYKCTHSGGIFTQAQYAATTFTTYAGTSSDKPFYKNSSTGHVFVKLDGVYRHIYDQASLQCFITLIPNVHMQLGSTNPSPIGAQIGGAINYDYWMFEPGRPPRIVTRTDSGEPLLVQDIPTGKVYFVEKQGGPGLSYNARWIVSPEVFNYFKFNSANVVFMTINWNAPPGPGGFVPVNGWNLGTDIIMPQ